jgi:transposase InsO family protein
MHAAMKRRGWIVGREQTRRLMPKAGLRGVQRGKPVFTTISGPPLQAFNHAVWQTNSDLSELIHHSDRGSQYLSLTYTDRLAELGIAPSGGRAETVTTTPSPKRSMPPTRPS